MDNNRDRNKVDNFVKNKYGSQRIAQKKRKGRRNINQKEERIDGSKHTTNPIVYGSIFEVQNEEEQDNELAVANEEVATRENILQKQ